MSDYVHIDISIPPNSALSQVIGSIKGRNVILIARVHGESRRNFSGQRFLAPRYVVSPVGWDEATNGIYIQHQERKGQRLDQLERWM